MTDTTPTPSRHRRRHPSPRQKGETSISLWSVAVMFGFVFALLGGRAAIDAIQQQRYAQARLTSVYILRNGNEIGRSLEQLQVVNDRDYALVKATSAALDAGDGPLFNRYVAQAEVFSGGQLRLEQQVKDYQAAFDVAYKR